MSLFDHNTEQNSNDQSHQNQSLSGIGASQFHPIDDTKKLFSEINNILRDVRKMVDKASRAFKILGE